MTGGLALAVVPWITGLLGVAIADDDPHPGLFAKVDALFELLSLDPPPLVAGAALARAELALLGDLGFSLDLERCAVSGGGKELKYVSPRTGRAVTAETARGYEDRIFRLPPFLRRIDEPANKADILDALTLTRHFILRDLTPDRDRPRLTEARDLIDARLARLL
jgi:DNA repair protein RecO (recombination protein O)